MQRRDFLIKGGSVLLILPAGWALSSCDDDDDFDDDDDNGGGTPTGGTATRLRFTSSLVDGHTHLFDIAFTSLDAPPSAGISGNTSTDNGHVHVVTLTADELARISAGETITKDTSLSDGHLHTFQFARATGAAVAARTGTAHRGRRSARV
jgi:hypothetical protein